MNVQKLFPVMGTVHSIRLTGEKPLPTAERAKHLILELEQALSVFDSGSEVARLNRLPPGTWLRVSPHTFRLFQAAIHYGRLSHGAFDVTAGPLTALWREARARSAVPDLRDLEWERQKVDYRGIRLDWIRRRVCLTGAGQEVDFGGLAKGYALDCVRALLRRESITEAVVNLGGSVAVLGQEQSVGVRNPFDPGGAPLGVLNIQNCCVITSGTYEQSFTACGTVHHHILDPRTGWSARSGLCAVTLVGQRAAELDALATAAVVLGIPQTLPILKRQGIEAVFVSEQGKVFVTRGLQNRFQFQMTSA